MNTPPARPAAVEPERRLLRRFSGLLMDGAAMALLAAKVLQLLNSFLVSVAIVTAYGLPAVGSYALAMLPAALAAILATLGLANALPRLRAGTGQRAAIAILCGSAMLLPIGLATAGYGLLIGHDAAEAAAIALFALGGAFLGHVGLQQMLYVLQGRPRWSIIAPALQLAGILAAVQMDDLLGFAIVLTAFRLAACAAGYLPLGFAMPSRDEFRSALGEGLRFTPTDLLANASELVLLPLAGLVLTRGEIGLLGLARQFIAAADTPGWSFVQSRYPELVADAAGAGGGIARRNERLSFLAAGAVLLVATLMAFLVYDTPDLVPLLCIMLVALPARYMAYFGEQTLRATGAFGTCLKLAAIRLCVSVLLMGAVALAGLPGAVMAVVAGSFASGIIYRSKLLQRFPDMLRPLRPWRMA